MKKTVFLLIFLIIFLLYPSNNVEAQASTFGYESGGASVSGLLNSVCGSQYTCTEAGSATKLTAYISFSGMGNVKAAIYSAGDLSAPITNGVTDEVNFDETSTRWVDFTFSTPPTLSAQDYCLYVWAGPYATASLHRDVDVTVDRWFESHTYDGWPSLSASDRTGKFSIYCTYTAGAGPSHTDAELSETVTPTSSLSTVKTLTRIHSETSVTTTTIQEAAGIHATLVETTETVIISSSLETVKHVHATLVELAETLTIIAALHVLLPAVELTSSELIALIIVFFVIGLGVSFAAVYAKNKK